MQPVVQFGNVTKRFPNGVTALNGINLEFFPGQVAVVLGPSGAGKSTLLRIINGLESPTEGTVTVGDLSVTPGNHRAVRKRVGMVFQQFNLVPRLSVMANVLCGRLAYRNIWTSLFFTFPASDFQLAEQALAAVGLADRAWDRVDKLSGGQQQRVAIARTMVQQGAVILADEPVASLDPATSIEIMDILVKIAKDTGCSLILNLHQVDLALKYGERIIGIKRGVVQFDSKPSDLGEDQIAALYAA
jgi:phosphonate transport system ATP-binding protein